MSDREMLKALQADGEKLRQLTGEDHGPQQLFTCEACDGSGVEVFGAWVYEHGCGVPHKDGDERPCSKCDGVGWWIDDAIGDAP